MTLSARGDRNQSRKQRSFLPFFVDTAAVSEVMGFILIIGILVSGTSIYLSLQLPEWTKELEAEHADQVPHDFAELDSAIDLAILRADTTTPVESTIGMVSRGVPLVGVGATGGAFFFDPHAEPITIIAGTGEVVEPGNTTWWNCSPQNFSSFPADNLINVVTDEDRGAELALELGDDETFGTGDDEYLAGEYWYNNFVITNGTTVYTSGLAIHAMKITIGPNSAINADSGGAAGAKFNNPVQGIDEAKGPGKGESPDAYSAGGGGAGYGAEGGNGGSSNYGSGGTGGSGYGDKKSITVDDTGSGGGCGRSGKETDYGWFTGGEGGDGGGTVYLDAPVITVEGIITACGSDGSDGEYTEGRTAADSAAGGGGGGSGGVIMLQGDTITLNGTLYANGGTGGNGGNASYYESTPNGGGGGGGGAGGRIKVLYETNIIFDGTFGTHAKVNLGAGGAGGVVVEGSGDPGMNGSDGESGTNYSDAFPYTPPIFHYDTGYLTSPVYNLSSALVRYGVMNWSESVDDDTNIIMKVRTSAVASMSESAGFAMPWELCPEVTQGQPISELSSVSDGHQYIQWRAELVTFDLTKTPTLHAVNISYSYGTPLVVAASGLIRYCSNYYYLPELTLDYARGAAIQSQSAGEFMLFPPSIRITKQGNTTFLKITTVNLTGGAESTQGALRTTVETTYQDAVLITGGLNYFNISINLTSTAHPAIWENWFNETCHDAGLTYGNDSGEYELSRTGNSVRVRFYGNESRPVNVWLKRAEVVIVLLKKQ